MKKTSESKRPCGWLAALAATLIAFGTPALSQALPPQQPAAGSRDPIQDDAQEQRRAQERERILREQQERTPDVRLQAPPPGPATAAERLPLGESPCFVIDRLELNIIRSDPATAADFDWALDAASGPGGDDVVAGRCIGTDGVALLARRVQDALILRGLVTTRVLAAPQDLRSGRLALTVVPGRIHAVRDADASDHRGNTWTALPASPGDILNLRDIEQALENLKRVPTAEADIQIEAASSGDAAAAGQPAATSGQSDLVISYRQPMPFRLSVSLDDSGSKATGRYQGGLTFSYDNALTLNDLLYVSLNHDVGTASGQGGQHGTQGNAAHYSVPFGYWLLGFNASTSRYRQTVAGANQDYVYSGSSSNLDMKLSRLAYRDASRKTTLSLRAFRRSSANFIDDTEIEVQHRVTGGFEAALNHQEFIGAATLDVGLAHKRGTGAFGALPAPEEAFGEGTSRMRITMIDAALNAPFKAWDQALRYTGALRVQASQSALTSQDLFAIGGRYTVRGFDGESSLSAERGVLLRNELAVSFGTCGCGDEAYAALDAGRVTGAASEWLAGKSLVGAAIGLRGAWGGVHYDVFMGAPLRKPALFRTATVTGGFALNYAF
ncbi:MAG: ShlB/FhaC/HecB family hemolysin secretion/activation protein [Comamonadaceae bacterium]|nr:MAG: ShlB/FhaC/HecB family hemolysin secretion/activation protein [Comamonadaceae bacterium]